MGKIETTMYTKYEFEKSQIHFNITACFYIYEGKIILTYWEHKSVF